MRIEIRFRNIDTLMVTEIKKGNTPKAGLKNSSFSLYDFSDEFVVEQHGSSLRY